MIPHHTWVGSPVAPHLAFVLHGVLGAGHNFRSFIRRLADARPEYRFALIDLRYHGRSLGAPPPHTLEACADDLLDLARAVGQEPRAVIGHSLGGKVALAYGRRQLEPVCEAPRPEDAALLALRQIWALDSDPGGQEPHHSHQVLRVVASLKRHPGPFASRALALAALEAYGLSRGLGNWLVTSLERSTPEAGETHLSWRFQLPEIEQLLVDYFSTDLWPFLERAARQAASDSPRFDLLVAENSDRWSGNMRERALGLSQSGGFRLHELTDSGHWVHVDNPDGLLRILSAELL